jgi:hypothetical protein
MGRVLVDTRGKRGSRQVGGHRGRGGLQGWAVHVVAALIMRSGLFGPSGSGHQLSEELPLEMPRFGSRSLRNQSEGGQANYPHLLIDPVSKHCHVPVHSRSVGLGTASSPACIPNQPPDAILQCDQRPSTVTLGDTARYQEQKGKLQPATHHGPCR